MTRPAPPRASAHRRTGYHIWLLVLLVHVTGVAAIFWLANHPGNVLLQVAHVPETAMLKAQWLGASGMKTDSPHNRITKSAASTSVSLPRVPTRKPVRAEAIPSTVAIKPDSSSSRTSLKHSVPPSQRSALRPSSHPAMDDKSGSKRQIHPEQQYSSVERSRAVEASQSSVLATTQYSAKTSPSQVEAPRPQTQFSHPVSSAVGATTLPATPSTLHGTALEAGATLSDVNREHGGPVITQARYRQTPVPAEYPPLARRRGIEGRVLVQVWLDGHGEQLKREIIESSGSALLDQAALRSVSRNQFLPHTLNGVGHAARLRLPVIFRLHP